MPSRLQPSICNALLRQAIDLRRLYRHAARQCEPGLRVVLNESAQTLDLLIDDLQAQRCAEGGTPRRHGSWRGAGRRHLAGWLVRVAARRDSAWVRALAHHENALLRAFEQALADAPPDAALALRRQLSRLRDIHLDMDSLGGAARY
jgi:uncharacterized protein (TIGR02284 family)